LDFGADGADWVDGIKMLCIFCGIELGVLTL
jgi:hypothetical protein